MLIGKQQKLLTNLRIREAHTTGIPRFGLRKNAPSVAFQKLPVRKSEQRRKWFKGEANQPERVHSAPRMSGSANSRSIQAASLAIIGRRIHQQSRTRHDLSTY